jgi:aminomuconate-semialdehyde/2-hydroxymuconate-6-semialdehyde dehydrogenase
VIGYSTSRRGRRHDRHRRQARRSPGFFVEPTIITGLDLRCRVLQEEIFGPVVTITPFEARTRRSVRELDALRPLGDVLDARSAARASRRRAHRRGTVWINCWLLRDLRVPFGGMKESGVGREGGFESLNFFTEQKNVCVKL